MISSHRLIVMYFLMSLVVGIAGEIHMSPEEYSNDRMQETINTGEGFENDWKDNSTKSVIYTDDDVEAKTTGNPLKMGSILWDVIISVMNPFSIHRGQFTTTFERRIADVIMLFRVFMFIIMALEMYFIWKNKKHS